MGDKEKTFLGFCPNHFRAWADNFENDLGYKRSQLGEFLRRLAYKIEQGDVHDDREKV